MVFTSFTLEGETTREIDTEIKYMIASARTDGAELVSFRSGGEVFATVLKILRGLKKSGAVQFFVVADELLSGGRESEFLLNKYGELIADSAKEQGTVFVKI